MKKMKPTTDPAPSIGSEAAYEVKCLQDLSSYPSSREMDMAAVRLIMQEQKEAVEKTTLMKGGGVYTPEEVALLLHVFDNADMEPKVQDEGNEEINWLKFHHLYICLAKALTVYRNANGEQGPRYYYRTMKQLQCKLGSEKVKEKRRAREKTRGFINRIRSS